MNPVTTEEKRDITALGFYRASYATYLNNLRIKGFVSPKIEEHTFRNRICFEKDAGMLQQCKRFQLKMNGIIALPINTAIEIVPTTIPNAKESIRSSF
jgi:hypothetical protein